MIRLVSKNLYGYRLITILAPVSKMLEAIIELFIPLVVANIIDKGIKNNNNPYILKMCGLMLILYVVGFCFSIICQYLASVCAFGFGSSLRKKLFAKINTLTMQQIESFGASTLVVRVNTDCYNVLTALNRFIRLVTRAPFILIGALIMAVSISARLSLIFFAVSILIAISLYLILKFSNPRIKRVNNLTDTITQKTTQNLAGARVIKAFNKTNYEQLAFNDLSSQLKHETTVLGAISALTNPLTYLFVNCAVILILYLGSDLVYTGANETGQIIALINYLSQILNALVIIATLTVLFSKAGASAKRISQVLDCTSEPKTTKEDIIISEHPKTTIEFKNVSYRILKNISFCIEPHQTLGIIGGTGSGKTTLTNLIAGLYPHQGQITLFDTDINEYPLTQLRQIISLAHQKSVLLSGNIRDNIKMGNTNATDQEIFKALEDCCCDFIRSLEAHVSRGGTNFSGGQRQRLSLARMLIKNPKIIIIDDGLSALDTITEQKITSKLKSMPSTKVIVSQRLSSIKHCDKIIVLDQGEAVGIGNHQQLLSSCPVYQEIYEIQEASNEI